MPPNTIKMVDMKNCNSTKAMKKNLYLALVAAFVATMFSACDKEVESEPIEEPNVEEQALTVNSIKFSLGSDETKAYIADDEGRKYAKWESTDFIGSVTTNSIGFSEVDASSLPATFNVYSEGGLSKGDVINLWYPYVDDPTDATSVEMSIPTVQYSVKGKYDGNGMPMVAKQITVTDAMVSATDETVVENVAFYNLGSLIHFKVFTGSSYTSEKVLSVTFNGNKALAGSFTKNLTTVDPADESTLTISGYSATSVKTNVIPFTTVGTEGTPLDVYMVIAPGEYTGSIVVETDAASYTWTISSAKEFVRSGYKSFGLKLDKASATRTPLVKGSFNWDLSRESYDAMSSTAAEWSHGMLVMDAAKANAGTATNNYCPPSKTETRFYNGSTLGFTVGSMQIDKVVVTTGTTTSHAGALAGSNWTNATASYSGRVVTIIPGDGSADFEAEIGGTTSATSVQVYYDNTDYTIAASSSPAAGGTCTIKKGDEGVTSAKVNTTITLSATPNSGYTFSGWNVRDSEDHIITVTSNQFKMPAKNVTVVANFAEVGANPTITIAPYSNGTVSTTPASSAAAGTTVTITATPATGYELVSLTVKDASNNDVAVNSSNQFTMPDKNVTVTAVFAHVAVLSHATFTSAGITLTSTATTTDATSTIDGISVTYKGVSQNAKNTPTGSGKADSVKPKAGQLVLFKKSGDGYIYNASSLSLKKVKIELTGTAYNSTSCAAITVSSKASGDADYAPVALPGVVESTKGLLPASGSTPVNVNTFIYEIDMTGKNFFKIVTGGNQVNVYSITVIY